MEPSTRAAPEWIQIVRPITIPVLQPIAAGSRCLCWYAELQFQKYAPPAGTPKQPWSETYGKTQVVGDDGRWSVAEIELVRRLRAGGWSAGWIDTFGSAPSAWAGWLVHPGELATPLRRSFNAITDDASVSGGGKPDVIAWRGDALSDAVFIEYKGPSDRVRPGQDAWLESALRKGVSPDQFLVAKWPKPRARSGRLLTHDA
jgi:hypothetical protein